MSATLGFGEYETILPRDCIHAALTFHQELFSRDYVVQRVTLEPLVNHVQANDVPWQHVAQIHTGHVVVRVDGNGVRGMSRRQFAELWDPHDTRNKAATRRVRFCDRKRAELEVDMQKQWPRRGRLRWTCVRNEAELQSTIRAAHTLIWDHELSRAHAVLHSLPVGRDPTVCLLAVELEVVRVLVSNDTLYAMQAQAVVHQAITWLETLGALSSLSYSSRTQTQLALAEALVLSTLLRLGGDRPLAAMASARRCSALYVKLHEEFCAPSTKQERLLMSSSELHTFQKRIGFGMGVLHAGGALMLKTSFDWVGALLIGTCDVEKGVEYLLDCGTISGGGHYVQANWAALVLMHCSGAIRLVQQRSNQGVSDQLVRAISACRQAALQRHPKALLFQWVDATGESCVGNGPKLLAVELARVAAGEERAHLVRFDVGFRSFLARECADSAPQFMAICKSTSAPVKLRGLSSLFLAAVYLMDSQQAKGAKMLNSVRLLLRSARRFLALRLADHVDDFESASLHERVTDYLGKSDEHMQLLPWELLYVYCHFSTPVMMAASSDAEQHQQHLAALQQLDRLANNGEANQPRYDAAVDPELILLRAIIRFHVREWDACDKELQHLWLDLLPQGSRPRAKSSFGRLQCQRYPCPPAPFVAPVAWFYQLRLLLERKCSRSRLKSITTTSADPLASLKCNMTTSQDSGFSFTNPAQHSLYPYHYIYHGKTQALSKLIDLPTGP